MALRATRSVAACMWRSAPAGASLATRAATRSANVVTRASWACCGTQLWQPLAVRHASAASSAAEVDIDGEEPIDWTSIIPDNLQLHNPRDVMPLEAAAYATDDVKTVPVLSFKNPGEVVGEVTLDNRVFGVEIRPDIVHRVVQWQLANRRTKVYKTKTISETSGGGRKPWAQKHTGRARTGSIRGSQWRGGAKPHGPKIRSWSQKLNKKVRKAGLKIALASKFRDRRLVIVDDTTLESTKTGELANLLAEHGWDSTRVLMIDDFEDSFLQASANVKRVHPIAPEGANVFSILKMDVLVLTPSSLEDLYYRLIDEYAFEAVEEEQLDGVAEGV